MMQYPFYLKSFANKEEMKCFFHLHYTNAETAQNLSIIITYIKGTQN